MLILQEQDLGRVMLELPQFRFLEKGPPLWPQPPNLTTVVLLTFSFSQRHPCFQQSLPRQPLALQFRPIYLQLPKHRFPNLWLLLCPKERRNCRLVVASLPHFLVRRNFERHRRIEHPLDQHYHQPPALLESAILHFLIGSPNLPTPPG